MLHFCIAIVVISSFPFLFTTYYYVILIENVVMEKCKFRTLHTALLSTRWTIKRRMKDLAHCVLDGRTCILRVIKSNGDHSLSLSLSFFSNIVSLFSFITIPINAYLMKWIIIFRLLAIDLFTFNEDEQ